MAQDVLSIYFAALTGISCVNPSLFYSIYIYTLACSPPSPLYTYTHSLSYTLKNYSEVFGYTLKTFRDTYTLTVFVAMRFWYHNTVCPHVVTRYIEALAVLAVKHGQRWPATRLSGFYDRATQLCGFYKTGKIVNNPKIIRIIGDFS